MTLYELTEDILALKAKLESGEIDEAAFADTLEGLPVEDKLESIAKLIRTWEAEATAFTTEAEAFKGKAAVRENGVQRLKARVQDFLVSTDATEAKAGLFQFRLVANGGKAPLVIADGTDPSKVDVRLTNLRYSFNNEAIRNSLEAGEDIPWAKLGERGKHLRVQ